MITLTKENFAQKVQDVIERYYLQPLDGSPKIDLKSGVIERGIHGAMHAARAAIWALLIHDAFSASCDRFVGETMGGIADFLHVEEGEEETVLRLILLTTVCHDAGRKGEGADAWEKESSEIAKCVLKDVGLTDEQADVFANAILYKDNQAEFKRQTKQYCNNTTVWWHLDYIRLLINLGDNLDLVRCVGEFHEAYLDKTLNSTLLFRISYIGDIASQIHAFVHEQGDMRFACKLYDSNGNVIATKSKNLSLEIKKGYEHADNVFLKMLSSVMRNPYFKTMLPSRNAVLATSMPQLTNDNLADNLQAVIETYCLLPSGRNGVEQKRDGKDGYLARIAYGGMHAARATWWALCLHQLVKQHFSRDVSAYEADLSRILNMELKNVPALIGLMSGLKCLASDDGYRSNWLDRLDVFAIRNVLIEVGITDSEMLRDLQSLYGWDPLIDLMNNKLDSYSWGESKNGYVYVTLIMGLSWYIESFHFGNNVYVNNAIEYTKIMLGKEVSTPFLTDLKQFMLAAGKFIHKQGDVLRSCEMFDEDGKRLTKFSANLSEESKVVVEQATNVLSVVSSEARHEMGEQWSERVELSCPLGVRFDLSSRKFAPFIHGTSSAALPILVKTNHAMMPIIDMMRAYQVVPMVGEFYRGGYQCLSAQGAHGNWTGRISFGVMSRPVRYNLDTVIREYATDLRFDEKFVKAVYKDQCRIFNEYGDVCIDEFLITTLRLLQNGSLNDKEFNTFKVFADRCEGLNQYYFFLRLFHRHLRPNPALKSCSDECVNRGSADIHERLRKQLDFQTMVDAIMRQKMDMQAIYDDPTPDNLKKALSLFDEAVAWLDNQPLFVVKQETDGSSHELGISPKLFPILGGLDDRFFFANFITHGFKWGFPDVHFEQFADKVVAYHDALMIRLDIIRKISSKPRKSFQLTEEDLSFVRDPFPIVLVATEHDKIAPYHFYQGEYRAIAPLQLGVDIKMIATQTQEQRLKLMRFFEKQGIRGIQYVLFEDLKKAEKDQTHPTSPYQHQDGIEKLSWLAAKALPTKVPRSKVSAVSVAMFGANQENQVDEACKRLREAGRLLPARILKH